MADINGDNNDNVLVGTPDDDQIRPRGGRDTITGLAGTDTIRIGRFFENDPVEEGRNGIFDRVTDFTPIDEVDSDTFELTGIFQPHYNSGGTFGEHINAGRAVRVLVNPDDGITYLLVDEDGVFGGSDWVTIAQLDGIQVGDRIDVDTIVDGSPRSTAITVADWPFGWDVTATDDFNGDGRDDVLWRHDNDEVYIWSMNGTQFNGQSLGIIDNAWNIAGTGDFNGDGTDEILWRHDNGEVQQNGISQGTIDNAWQIATVADFNGDGTDQILWRHEVTGEVLLDGQSLGTVDIEWQVVGAGDFDGNGTSEVLWRHESGEVGLNGTHLGAANGLNVLNSREIEDIADFNGDGRSDILWRHNSDQNIGGEAYVWYMDGTQATQSSLGVIAHDWEIDAAGDFSGDGSSEIFWRHENGDIHLNGLALDNVATSLQDVYLI